MALTLDDTVRVTHVTTGGDRVAAGREIKARRDALGISREKLAVVSGVSNKTLENIEHGVGGHTRAHLVLRALDKLERGEDPLSEVVRVQVRPGVWVTISADDVASMRDVRSVEDALRGMADGPK
jgi:transcriptional regulator with XRE-family HTH domain